MRIGELARRTQVSPRLLRYYEQQGLLRPERLPSGYRVYQDCDVTRVGHIRTLLAAGLNTTLIAQVLPCVRVDGTAWLTACAELTRQLRAEHSRIAGDIAHLERSRAILEDVMAAAGEPVSAAR